MSCHADQRDVMERPFFSLSKTKRVTPDPLQIRKDRGPGPRCCRARNGNHLGRRRVDLGSKPDTGSDRASAFERRVLSFHALQLLTAIGRATGKREYLLLKGALTRLQSTVVRTTIRHGEHWRRQQFSWINECGRTRGMLRPMSGRWSSSCRSGSIRASSTCQLVLAIDPAYLALSGGIERWLYRVARKHSGRQPQSWRFKLRHLRAKSARRWRAFPTLHSTCGAFCVASRSSDMRSQSSAKEAAN